MSSEITYLFELVFSAIQCRIILPPIDEMKLSAQGNIVFISPSASGSRDPRLQAGLTGIAGHRGKNERRNLIFRKEGSIGAITITEKKLDALNTPFFRDSRGYSQTRGGQ